MSDNWQGHLLSCSGQLKSDLHASNVAFATSVAAIEGGDFCKCIWHPICGHLVLEYDICILSINLYMGQFLQDGETPVLNRFFLSKKWKACVAKLIDCDNFGWFVLSVYEDQKN